MLRRIFGPKWEEVAGEWRKLHKEELRYLYTSLIIGVTKSRRMRWAGRVARMRESRGVYRDVERRPEGKIPLRRPRRKWEDNISIDLQEEELRGGVMDRIELAQDRDRWRADVNAIMDFRDP